MDINGFEVVKDESVDEAKKELLEKAVAFEEMTRSKGWGFVKAYAQESLNRFSVRAMSEGFKSMEDYQLERGKVAGIFSLLNEIESALKALELERNP